MSCAMFDFEYWNAENGGPLLIIRAKPKTATVEDAELLLGEFDKFFRRKDLQRFIAIYDLRDVVQVPYVNAVVKLGMGFQAILPMFKENLIAAAVVIRTGYIGLLAKGAVNTVTSIAKPVAPFTMVFTEEEARDWLLPYKPPPTEKRPRTPRVQNKQTNALTSRATCK